MSRKVKRLLLCLIAVAVGISAKAAYEYDATISGRVKVTDLSLRSGGRMVYQYMLEYTQIGKNSSGSYTSSAVLIIYPDGPSIAGTFTYADGSIDYDSYVKYGTSYRYVTDYTGKPTSVTITDNGNDTFTLSGAFRTKSQNSYYYYYYDASDPANTFEYKAPKPYANEPEAGSFTFNASGDAVKISDFVSREGLITVDVFDKDNNFVELAVVADEFALPAGTYSVSDSADKGTVVKASGVMGGPYPEGSYLNYDNENYFITGGSVTVSYSDDASSVTFAGTLTTAHGSVIAISAMAGNPFKTYEHETRALTVSSIVATVHPKDTYDNKDYVLLDITAKNGTEDCNGRIRVNSPVLEGSYDYLTFHGTYTFFGKDASGWYDNYIYGQDKNNSMTIEKTGNADEYRLNSRISCGGEKDYVIYTITDALFTWEAPTPFDAEPDNVSTIDAEYACIAEVGKEAGTTTVFVENSDFSPLSIVFAGTGDLLPCRYIVDSTGADGTVVASAGRGETGGGLAETGTWYGDGISVYDYRPYYITGGFIDVNYAGGNVEFIGRLTSKKGSTVNVHAVCPNNVCETPFPVNVMRGPLLGTSAQYTFAYDVTSSAGGDVLVNACLSTTEEVGGLKPGIRVNGVECGFDYDSRTGSCKASASGAGKGEEIEIQVFFEYGAGTTAAKTIRYKVE